MDRAALSDLAHRRHQWSGGAFDVVMCVGASHVFGDLAATLAAVRQHLRPGGQVLLGDVFWETPPTPGALTGSLVDWALHDAASDADRDQALAAAREHRQQWLGGYRGVPGFATLVLHDIATPHGTRP